MSFFVYGVNVSLTLLPGKTLRNEERVPVVFFFSFFWLLLIEFDKRICVCASYCILFINEFFCFVLIFFLLKCLKCGFPKTPTLVHEFCFLRKCKYLYYSQHLHTTLAHVNQTRGSLTYLK